MPTRTEYFDAPGCIFVSPTEWSLIEYDLPPEKQEEYGQKGYPRIELGDGASYTYMPVEINGKSYKLVDGKRPIKSVEEIE